MASEMYYYNDNFYSEIEDCFEDLIFEELSDDFVTEVEECTLQPIFTLDSRNLFELIQNEWEENSTEEGDEWDLVQPILEKYVDFKAINEAVPHLFFPNGTKIKYTKAEIMAMWPSEDLSTPKN